MNAPPTIVKAHGMNKQLHRPIERKPDPKHRSGAQLSGNLLHHVAIGWSPHILAVRVKMGKNGSIIPMSTATMAHLRKGSHRPQGKPAIGVLTVDDHPALRAGMSAIVRGHPQFDLVGEVCDGDEALEQFLTLSVRGSAF